MCFVRIVLKLFRYAFIIYTPNPIYIFHGAKAFYHENCLI